MTTRGLTYPTIELGKEIEMVVAFRKVRCNFFIGLLHYSNVL